MMTPAFTNLLRIEVATAQASFPHLADAIGRANALLLDGHVFPNEDGKSAAVLSSEGDRSYFVNGSCHCQASQFAATPCKHRLSFRLYQKVSERLTPSQAPAPTIDPVYITTLHGKTFVKYDGLLQLAHARGLVSLKARFTHVDHDIALAEAEAVFADGRVFVEAADATKENVPPHIKPHVPRMALTRAKARCLRMALAVDMCSLEELGEGVDHG